MKKWLYHWFGNPERVIGIILIVVGIVGLQDTIFGEWRVGGPGYGAKFFPQVVFVAIISMGAYIQLATFRDVVHTKVVDLADLKALVLLVGTGYIYFEMVQAVGLLISTFVYSGVLVALLTVKPGKQIRKILIPAVIATAIVWLLFTRLVDLPLPPGLLV